MEHIQKAKEVARQVTRSIQETSEIVDALIPKYDPDVIMRVLRRLELDEFIFFKTIVERYNQAHAEDVESE